MFSDIDTTPDTIAGEGIGGSGAGDLFSITPTSGSPDLFSVDNDDDDDATASSTNPRRSLSPPLFTSTSLSTSELFALDTQLDRDEEEEALLNDIFASVRPATTANISSQHNRGGSTATDGTTATTSSVTPSAASSSHARKVSRLKAARRKTASLFDEDEDDLNIAAAATGATTTSINAVPAVASNQSSSEDVLASSSLTSLTSDDSLFNEAELALDLERVLAQFASPSPRNSTGSTSSIDFGYGGMDDEGSGTTAAFFSSTDEDVTTSLFGTDSTATAPTHSPPVSTRSMRLSVEDSIFTLYDPSSNAASEAADSSFAPSKQRIKLTPTEMQLLRDNGSVSQVFAMKDVFCVTCSANSLAIRSAASSSSPHDTEASISISFINDIDLTFYSTFTQAKTFSSELNERVAKCRKMELEGGSNPPIKVHRDIISTTPTPRSASSSVEANTPTTFFAKAESGGARKSMPKAASSHNLKKSSSSEEGGLAGEKTKAATAVTTKSSSSSTSTASDPWQRQYLLDQQIQTYIDKLWITSSSAPASAQQTDEAKARQKFLKAFPSMEKNPKTLCLATRKFLDSFKNFIVIKREKLLKSQIMPKLIQDEKVWNDTFSVRVERSSEVAILLPVLPKLIATIQKEFSSQDEEFNKKCTALKDRDQLYFGIREKHVSPSSWSHAISELTQLTKFDLPQDKLQVLLGTAKAVYQTFESETKRKREVEKEKEENAAAKAASVAVVVAATSAVSDATTTNAVESTATATTSSGESPSTSSPPSSTPSTSPSPTPSPTSSSSASLSLPADDFFPIFVYVVAHTPLTHAVTVSQLMFQLCDPAQLNSEGGYYLTVFSGAVEFLKRVDTSKSMATDKK